MRSKIRRNIVFSFLIIGLTVLSFGGGFFFGQGSIDCEVCKPEELDFSLFWEAYETLKKMHVGSEDISYEDVLYGAISGMVNSLDDPYTIFLNPEDAKIFMEDVAGRFEGVGMEIGIREGLLRIIAPLEGTPAKKAGLLAGDRIVEIDGNLTSELTLDEAVVLIRGPRGTRVVLTIMREGWDEPRDIEVERAIIEVPSLEWELREGNIAYIKIYHFSEKATFDFSKIVIQALSSGTDRVIVDLRNNPGGYLEVAVDIAGFFLEKGELVVVEDYGDERNEYRARGTAVLSDYPVVVLINEGSASGSEILAGALRDIRGIKLIGETSFGKGSVQLVEKLRGGSSLKVTIAKWLTPSGHNISEVGLEPDIVVEMTEEDYLQERDPQLNKAIEVIKGL